MTAPPCNPATLRGPCAGDCGRQLHASPASRQRLARRACDHGHPVHDSHGLCGGCRMRRTRAQKATPPSDHPYCIHDEGERCDCATALAARKRPTVAPRPAAELSAERAAAVARLTAQGRTAAQIAGELGIGVRSVVRLRGRAT